MEEAKATPGRLADAAQKAAEEALEEAKLLPGKAADAAADAAAKGRRRGARARPKRQRTTPSPRPRPRRKRPSTKRRRNWAAVIAPLKDALPTPPPAPKAPGRAQGCS